MELGKVRFNKLSRAVFWISSILIFALFVQLSFFYPLHTFDKSLLVYMILVMIPLAVIGVWGGISLKGENKLKQIIFYAVLLAIFGFVFVHSSFETCDYLTFLKGWCGNYGSVSFKQALFNIVDVSNYTPFYNYFLIVIAKLGVNSLYAIKYVTFAFSILLAFVIEKIVCHLTNSRFNFLRFVVFLILPPVLIEYSAWGQCDAIYVTFAMLALLFALKKKSALSFAFVGLSFAIKLQFLFIVPVLFVMLIVKDENGEHYLKWKHLWIAPLMYAVNLIPVLAGRPVLDVLMVYLNQTVGDNRISGCCGNLCYIYHLLGVEAGITLYSLLVVFQIVLTIAIMVLILFVIFKKNKQKVLTKTDLLFFGMLFAFVMVFFMPKMLDRFYFIAMCLTWIYFFANKNSRSFFSLILINDTLVFMMYLHFYIYLSTFVSVMVSIVGMISAFANLVILSQTFWTDYAKDVLIKSKKKEE